MTCPIIFIVLDLDVQYSHSAAYSRDDRFGPTVVQIGAKLDNSESFSHQQNCTEIVPESPKLCHLGPCVV